MAKTKEEKYAYNKEWRAKNPDKVRVSAKKHYEENKDVILAKQKVKRDANKGNRRAYNTGSLVGDQYGKLTVVSVSARTSYETGKKCTFYWCRCFCGKEVEVARSSLVTGNTKSCGCVRIEKLRARKLRPYEYVYNLLVARTKKRDGIECDISYEDFVKFTEFGKCHYCDAPIQWALQPKDRDKLGHGHHLDRMDNDKPYSLENCVVCCRRCNWGKGDMFSYEEWKKIGEVIKTFPSQKV